MEDVRQTWRQLLAPKLPSVVDERNLVPIALFASLSQRGLGTRNEGPFVSRAKAAPAKRSEKGDGDKNGMSAPNLLPRFQRFLRIKTTYTSRDWLPMIQVHVAHPLCEQTYHVYS